MNLDPAPPPDPGRARCQRSRRNRLPNPRPLSAMAEPRVLTRNLREGAGYTNDGGNFRSCAARIQEIGLLLAERRPYVTRVLQTLSEEDNAQKQNRTGSFAGRTGRDEGLNFGGGSGFMGQPLARSGRPRLRGVFLSRQSSAGELAGRQVHWERRTTGAWVATTRKARTPCEPAGRSVNCRSHHGNVGKILASAR